MAEIDSLEISIQSTVNDVNKSIDKLIGKLGIVAKEISAIKTNKGLDSFAKQAESISSSMDKMSNSVKNASKQIDSAMGNVKKSISDIDKPVNQVKKSMEDIVEEISDRTIDITPELNMKNIPGEIKKYENQLRNSQNALNRIRVSDNADKQIKGIERIVIKINEARNALKKLNEVNQTGDFASGKEAELPLSTDEAKRSLDDIVDELDGYMLALRESGDYKPFAEAQRSLEKLIEKFPEATEEIKFFEAEFERLYKKEYSGKSYKGLAEIPEELKQSGNAVEELGQKISGVDKEASELGNAFANIHPLEFKGDSFFEMEKWVNDLQTNLEKLHTKQERLNDLGINPDSRGMKNLALDIEQVSKTLDVYEKELEEARAAGKLEIQIPPIDAPIEQIVSKTKILKDNLADMKINISADSLKEVEKQIEKVKQSYMNLVEKMGKAAAVTPFYGASTDFKKKQIELSALRQKYQDLINKQKELAVSGQTSASGLDSVSGKISKISATGGKASVAIDILNSSFKVLSKAANSAATAIKNALKGLSSIVSGAFSKIVQVGNSAASSMKKATSSIVSAFSKITHSSKGLNTASSNLKNLFKAIVGFKGIQGLLNFGKEALEYGSAITEVENVVDVAFGSMRQHAYDFASTATEQFGLSELAAKQYSGTMMAMLKSSGVAQAQAAKMSTTLAGLAGDLASFYNLETDEAFSKLRSAISGETEPMKALGVNMNIVNLEAFAMSQGINKAYKEMSLAEQTMLRYNYILAKTTDAQGDFAKTAGTYANQLRLLKLNFQSISAVIGQGLIAAVLPAMKALNALMSKLMGVAKVFRNFMYTLTGFQPDKSGVGIVDDMADNLEDVGDAAEETGKKIKKNLLTLPFDELNILTDTSDDLSDALEDIGDIDMGLDGIGDLSGAGDDYKINEWAKKLRDAFLSQDWEGLGRTIAELINKGLEWLYKKIKDITPKVEQALKNLAKVINSFIKNLDWDLLGRTIGAGINLLTTAFNALFGDDGINLELLGEKLSVGLRGMIDEVDWQGLGNAIGNYLMIAWRIAYGFIEDMWRIDPNTLLTGWAEAGNALGDMVNGIFERIDFVKISAVLTEGFKGVLETITYFLNQIDFDQIVDKINAGLERLYSGLKWDSDAGQDMGQKITAFTDAISMAFNKLLDLDFGKVGQIIGAAITDIVRAFNQLTDISGGIDFEKIGKKISDGLRGLVTEIPWNEFGNALGNGFMLSWRILDGFLSDMAKKNDAGLNGWQEIGSAVASAINGIFEKINLSDIARILTDLINGMFSSLKQLAADINWDEIADNISSGINTAINNMNWKENGEALNDFLTKLLDSLLKAAEDIEWEKLGEGIGTFLSQIEWEEHLDKVAKIISESLGGLLEGLGETPAGKFMISFTKALIAFKISSYVAPFALKLASFLAESFKNKAVANAIEKGLSNALGGMGTAAGEGASAGGGLASKLGGAASTIGGILAKIGGFAAVIGGAITAIKNFFDMLKNGFDWVKEALMVIGIALAAVGAVILGAPAVVAGVVAAIVAAVGTAIVLIKEHWEGIKEFFGNLWSGIKDTAVEAWESMSTYLGETWEKLNDWASEKFSAIKEKVVDVWNGAKEKATEVWDTVTTYLGEKWENIRTAASEKFSQIKEKVSEAWNNARENAREVWDNVTSYLGEKWENIRSSAEQKFGEIKEKVSNAWQGAKENATEVWNAVTTYLGDKWESIRTSAEQKFSEIKEKVVSAWEGAKEKAHEVWDAVTTYLGEKWESIRASAEQKFTEIKAKVNEAWEGAKEKASEVWEAVTTYLSEKWETIRTNASEKFAEIKEKISNAWDGAREKATEVWDTVTTYLGEKWENIRSSAEEKFNDTKEKVIDAWKNIKEDTTEKWGDIKTDLEEKWQVISTNVKDTWNGIYDYLKEKIPKIVNDVVEWFKDLPGKIKEIAKNVLGGFIEGFVEKVGALRDKVVEVAGNVVDWFKEKLGIHSPSKVFYDLASNTIKGYEEGLESEDGTVQSKMEDIASTATTPFVGLDDEFNRIGTGMVSQLDAGVSAQISHMVDVMRGMIDKMMETFNNMDYNAIGTNMMNGISNGISNNVHSVLSSISSVASSMINRFTDMLGIHSPSKVFYGLAEYTMQGFINGVDSEEKTLAKTLANIATNIGQTFSDRFNKSLSMAVDGLSDYTYSITPELSKMSFKEGGFPNAFSMNENTNDYGSMNSGGYAGGEEFFEKIRQASYEGQTQAQGEMLSYLADIAQNTRETADKNLSVNIGDREIVDSYNRGKRRNGYSFT